MKDSEENKLKSEIDEIMKRINTIVKNIKEQDPVREPVIKEKEE
jgi:hypothetical protein